MENKGWIFAYLKDWRCLEVDTCTYCVLKFVPIFSSFAQFNTKNIGAWVYFITEEKSEYE